MSGIMVLQAEYFSRVDFNRQPIPFHKEDGLLVNAMSKVLASERPLPVSSEVVSLSLIPRLKDFREAVLELQKVNTLRGISHMAVLVEVEAGQPSESIIGKVVSRLAELYQTEDFDWSIDGLSNEQVYIVNASLIPSNYVFDFARLMSKNGNGLLGEKDFSSSHGDKVYGTLYIYPDTTVQKKGNLKINIGFLDASQGLRQEWMVNLNDFTVLLAN